MELPTIAEESSPFLRSPDDQNDVHALRDVLNEALARLAVLEPAEADRAQLARGPL